MKSRLLLYILVGVLTYSAISIAWSARDIQAYRIDEGVGFDMYQPRLGVDMALHVAILVLCLCAGFWYFKADGLLLLLYAVSTSYMFYFTHRDPFYKDWSEDCLFALLGYVVTGVFCFVVKDLVADMVTRIRRRLNKTTTTGRAGER
jgi:hypothetical protein